MRVLYDVLLACHIPFVAFTCKESMLIIVDEYQSKSLSRSFVEKMEIFNKILENKQIQEDISDFRKAE